MDDAADLRIPLALEAGGGVLVRRHHPELIGAADWLLRTGQLVPVLPGVYAAPEFVGVLIDSRDEPWSEAERRAHRLLHWRALRFTWAMLLEHPGLFLEEAQLALETQRQMLWNGPGTRRRRV